MNNQKALNPLTYLCALLIIAHIFMPHLKLNNMGPFFDWRLFSGLPTGSYWDIKLLTPQGRVNLTDWKPEVTVHKQLKFPLWKLARRAGAERDEFRKAEIKEKINALTTIHNIKFIGLCEIKKPLAEYMIASGEAKREMCEEVF